MQQRTNFVLSIDTGNDAFRAGDDGNDHGELARLLRVAADVVEAGGVVGVLRDVNGNTCGSWVWTADDEPAEPVYAGNVSRGVRIADPADAARYATSRDAPPGGISLHDGTPFPGSVVFDQPDPRAPARVVRASATGYPTARVVDEAGDPLPIIEVGQRLSLRYDPERNVYVARVQ